MLRLCPKCLIRQVDVKGTGKCQMCGTAFTWRFWRINLAAFPFLHRGSKRLCPGGLCNHEELNSPWDPKTLADFCFTCAATVKKPCQHQWAKFANVSLCVNCHVAEPKEVTSGDAAQL